VLPHQRLQLIEVTPPQRLDDGGVLGDDASATVPIVERDGLIRALPEMECR
jgi:hypothetical protein